MSYVILDVLHPAIAQWRALAAAAPTRSRGLLMRGRVSLQWLDECRPEGCPARPVLNLG